MQPRTTLNFEARRKKNFFLRVVKTSQTAKNPKGMPKDCQKKVSNLLTATNIIVQRLPKQLSMQMMPLISQRTGNSGKKVSPRIAPIRANTSIDMTPRSNRARLATKMCGISRKCFMNTILAITETKMTVTVSRSFGNLFVHEQKKLVVQEILAK